MLRSEGIFIARFASWMQRREEYAVEENAGPAGTRSLYHARGFGSKWKPWKMTEVIGNVFVSSTLQKGVVLRGIKT